MEKSTTFITRINPFHDHAEISGMLKGLQPGSEGHISGIYGSALAVFVHEMTRKVSEAVIVTAPSQKTCEDLVEDLSAIGLAAGLIPDPDLWEMESSLKNRTVMNRFMAGLTNLSGQDPYIMVCSSIAAIWKNLPAVLESVMEIKKGEDIEIDQLRKDLVSRNFVGLDEVGLPGEFAVRGGIIDIFSHADNRPVRIELIGDTVESIRYFSQENQRSIKEIDRFSIYDTVVLEGDERLNIFQLLPKETAVIWHNPVKQLEVFESVTAGLDDKETVLASETVESFVKRFKSVRTYPEYYPPDQVERCVAFGVDLPEGRIENLREFLPEMLEKNSLLTVYLCSVNSWERDILKSAREELDPGKQASVSILDLDLSSGFYAKDADLLVLSDKEIFKKKKASTYPSGGSSEPLRSFFQINEGDYIVHAAHGIGKCLGIRSLERDGRFEDFLCIEYDGGVKLYVPSLNIGMVQKYVGSGDAPPKLNRIGSKVWKRKKEKVKKELGKIAHDLLDIHAKRMQTPGHAYAPDTEEHKQFAALFPFQETPDQVAAINSVCEDMEVSVPMDRIICGDVGFGKTEIAIRAAFKSVMEGRQVAVVSPTTVLTEQHYKTFCDRFNEFPVMIERISRFRSKKDQEKILGALGTGVVDIIIGTHRLLQKDVVFKDLGLLVIDEEHRFGVKDKERIKRMRVNLDILTLTATPIPRTLHMSLSGVKSISVLSTPPQNRLPIITKITPFREDLIRDVILKEMSRGGQIYFVHNRVETIRQFTKEIKDLVPEATFGIIHGQMKEELIADAMEQFLLGKLDVLMTTSIIESGLDIPNVNSLLVDRTDRFGLAQLHQIRGRIGRSERQGYAYFLLPGKRRVTGKAEKRLRAIEDNTNLGAGFSLAMRDMEIRGVGNLLGEEQHGRIADIGYELYTRLLHESVERLKGNEPEERIEVDLRLGIPCYLPDDFVWSQTHKFQLYNKLYDAGALPDVDRVGEEIADRFGTFPDEVKNLLDVVKIRILCQNLNIPLIEIQKKERLVIDVSQMDMRHLAAMIAPLRGYKLTEAKRFHIGLDEEDIGLKYIISILMASVDV